MVAVSLSSLWTEFDENWQAPSGHVHTTYCEISSRLIDGLLKKMALKVWIIKSLEISATQFSQQPMEGSG